MDWDPLGRTHTPESINRLQLPNTTPRLDQVDALVQRLVGRRGVERLPSPENDLAPAVGGRVDRPRRRRVAREDARGLVRRRERGRHANAPLLTRRADGVQEWRVGDTRRDVAHGTRPHKLKHKRYTRD